MVWLTSGQTPAQGVTGELAYCGTAPKFNMENLQGKIALLVCPISARPWGEWYQVWGINPPEKKLPAAVRPARSSVNDIAPFLKAGGAKATLRLEADLIPDTSTDTLIATLPGESSDEIIIVNTHTDGPNATEENGGVGIVALAKYFAKIPKSERKRTVVFVLTTGHFSGPYVPSVRGVIEQHPELTKKAVAAVTIEHLGCREWVDDASLKYKAPGEDEWSVAISPHKGPADGCIEKLSAPLMHAQIEMFAKVLHRIDGTSAADLKA